MDDIAADLGELIFSLVVSYFGALEFFFVLRQWCHLTGKHPPCREFNDESLKELKEKLQRKIADAKEKEKQSGTNVMQDGVPYTDGYRIDPNQAEIDRLKAEINAKDSKEKRWAEIEAELAAHRKIEEETRKQLEAAEAELARQRAKTAADAKAESEAKAKAKAEAEAEEERKRKEQEEKAKAASEEAENYRKLLEAEKQREADQQAKEKENEALRLKREQEEKLFAAEKQREREEKDKEEREKHAQGSASEKFLDAERAREEKQKLIEENARKFLEAEEKMVQLQQKILEASNIPIVEEPIVKRSAKRLDASAPQTVKTQFGQGSNESFTLSSKPLLFPSISDDASSNEPHSSKHSSFSTQPSDEMTTGPENASKIAVPQHERQDPDGEDNTPSVEYTEDYLRSLDGLKVHPLTREDGSGRRRAFKKRRSSGSSNSSRDSRASRDEELKMFTSLEEEESKSIREGDKNDFTPIKYTSEPNLKVKSHHHRRHKRSPMQDAKANEDTNLRTSLEMLGEEGSNPWGEVVPEHYKNTEFWRREKAMSIDEEEIELDFTTLGGENQAKSSSFEDATDQQNEQAITELHSNHSKELNEKDKEQEVRDALANDGTKADTEAEKSKDTNLIFSGEYTKAMDKDWHSGHFCCWQCDESLTGQRYVIRDDHPYCIKCYENVFANTCEECNKIIGIDSKDLSYKDKHWHEACFLCYKCHLSLVDKQFGAKADKIYCGNCYDAQFASRCDGCGEVFRAGTKKMEYKTRQWHENCFCCCVCKTAIGTKSFIPREQEIYCASCYEEKFATRCIKCNKVITSGGVTYKNDPWHRECFTCTHCNITLAGQRFTSRDEKPYCAECFGELFAKRCTSCVKPITGIGGTRFISFEDRHWHHDCFVCASCKTSLVGRGFITDGPDIICPECAKQKLM